MTDDRRSRNGDRSRRRRGRSSSTRAAPSPADARRSAASQLRDELHAAATEVRDELRDAAAEVNAEVAAATEEIREELAALRRSLAVVWGVDDPPSRGPKATLTRDAIVDAAVGIADAEGLGGVSMRSIATELGVGTMSLYRHVPGKDELLTLMIDHVSREEPLVDQREGTWREQLEAMAWGSWQLAHAHPWLLSVPAMAARPVAGPNGLAVYESSLAAASRTGLPPREVVGIVSAVQFLVDGGAKASVDNALAASRTGVTDEQWWAAHAEILAEVFDPERYPTFAALDAAGAFQRRPDGTVDAPIDFTAIFAAGLEALLDGFELRVAAHRDT
jgi:AcrR family transcriptional regulator